MGKLSLVDLAGSERLDKAGTKARTTTNTIRSRVPRINYNNSPRKVTMKPASPPLPTMYPRVQTPRSVPHINNNNNSDRGVAGPIPARPRVQPSATTASGIVAGRITHTTTGRRGAGRDQVDQ